MESSLRVTASSTVSSSPSASRQQHRQPAGSARSSPRTRRRPRCTPPGATMQGMAGPLQFQRVHQREHQQFQRAGRQKGRPDDPHHSPGSRHGLSPWCFLRVRRAAAASPRGCGLAWPAAVPCPLRGQRLVDLDALAVVVLRHHRVGRAQRQPQRGETRRSPPRAGPAITMPDQAEAPPGRADDRRCFVVVHHASSPGSARHQEHGLLGTWAVRRASPSSK